MVAAYNSFAGRQLVSNCIGLTQLKVDDLSRLAIPASFTLKAARSTPPAFPTLTGAMFLLAFLARRLATPDQPNRLKL